MVSFCKLEKSPSKDFFQASKAVEKEKLNLEPCASTGAKSAADIRRLLSTPAIKERGIILSNGLMNILEEQPFWNKWVEKIIVSPRNFNSEQVGYIVFALTPENAKYLDILTGPVGLKNCAEKKLLKSDQICVLMKNLAKTEKSRLVELLSNETVGIDEVVAKIKKEEKALGLETIKDPKIKNAAEKFYDLSDDLFNPEAYNVFSNIEHKMKDLDDLKIKSYVENGLENLSKSEGKSKEDYLDSIEELLNAHNVCSGRYGNVYDNVDLYYRQLGNKHPWAKSALLKGIRGENLPAFDSPVMNERVLADFKKESKLEALKKYIIKNQKIDPEMTDYMYSEYYLKSLEPAQKQAHLKILDEFGTKTFSVEDKKAAKLVYSELSSWKKAGGGEFNPPSVIDLSQIKTDYLGSTLGYYQNLNNNISLKGDSESTILEALRHEIMHGNDRSFQVKGKNINGVDFDAIKESGRYRNEFINGGLGSDGEINYAYTNKREFVAVAAQCEFSRFSDEFKEVLVKLGMPEWVFKMDVTNPIIKENADDVALMRKYGMTI